MGTNIYDAAVYGDLDQVRKIIAADPEAVNETDEFGFTPLHGLAGEEHLEIAQFLIDRGAKVNAANDEGITPLHLATWPAMATLLLKNGADLEARSQRGETPLLVLAAENEREDVMAVLLTAGADANAAANDGLTALDIALAREEDDKAALLRRHGAKANR